MVRTRSRVNLPQVVLLNRYPLSRLRAWRWHTLTMTRGRPATLIEVAERAGVSLTTASKAINGKDRVSDETRARVIAAARELSFTPNPIARGLTTGRTSTVGLIIADSMSHRFAAATGPVAVNWP
jgi:hypothetical protein